MVCMTQTYIIATSLSCVKLIFRADGDSNIGDTLHLDGGLLNQNLTRRRDYLDADGAVLYEFLVSSSPVQKEHREAGLCTIC